MPTARALIATAVAALFALSALADDTVPRYQVVDLGVPTGIISRAANLDADGNVLAAMTTSNGVGSNGTVVGAQRPDARDLVDRDRPDSADDA